MDGIIHLVLLLYGLCPLSSCVPQRQYILVRMAKTWYEAQSFCREKCFDLATIHDMGEMETALTAVEDKHYDAAWIGLQKVPFKRWHWSLADKHFYKEGERNYFIWGWKTDYNCVFYKNGKLYSASCPTLRYSICFDGKEQGRDQYFLTTVRMSWTVARDYCRQFYTDLTSVRNDAEYQILQQVAGNQPVWVGLYRDHWEWSDRTYSSLRYWKASLSVYTKSVVSCGVLLRSEFGRWGERRCTEKHPFICNCGPNVRFFKVKISLKDSVLDVNEPAIQDHILELMRLELSKNISDDLQLQWRKQSDGRVFIKETG